MENYRIVNDKLEINYPVPNILYQPLWDFLTLNKRIESGPLITLVISSQHILEGNQLEETKFYFKKFSIK